MKLVIPTYRLITTTIKYIVVVLLFIFGAHNANAQAVGDYGTRTNTGVSTSWNTASNWLVCVTAGTWTGATIASTVPASTKTLWIRTGALYAATGTPACLNLNIESGATLSVGNATMTVSGTTIINGTFNLLSTSGSKTFIGATTVNSGGVWNNSANEAVAFRNGLTNNGTFTAGTGIYTFQTNAQALNGTLTIPNITATATITNNSNLTISTALTAATFINNATGTLNIGGTATITTLTTTAAGNTVNYAGAAQTVRANAYSNLTLSGTGVKTLDAATTSITGNLTLSGSATTTAVIGLTIGGNLVLDAGTSFNAASFTHKIAGNWVNNGGTFTPGVGTIEFNGTTQNIGGTTPTTFYNLISSVGGTKTLGASTTVSSNFTLSGGTFIVNNNTSYDLTVTGNYVQTGGILNFNTGSTGTSNLYLGGNFTHSAGIASFTTLGAGAPKGVVTFIGTGIQTINIATAGAGTRVKYIIPLAKSVELLSNLTLSRADLITESIYQGELQVNGTLNGGTFSISQNGGTTGTAVFSLNAGANLITSNASGVSGSVSQTNMTNTFSSGANYEFRGATTGTFTTSPSANTLNHLTINNAAGVTLSSNLTVNNTLSLTTGRLSLGTFNLTLGAAAAAVAGTLNASNMIVAGSTGELRKNFAANGSFLFPLGELIGTAEYSPITVNFASGTYTGGAYVSAKVTNAKHPNNSSVSNFLNRYWSVSSNGISAYSATVTGNYLAADIVGVQSNQATGKFLTSLPWVKYATLSANTLVAAGINSFGDFTGINNLPTITTSVSTLTGFSYPLGYGPSASQLFTVSGTDLNANIVVTPPTNFQISLSSGSGYQSTPISLPAIGGIVNTTTIYVRMISALPLGAVASANVAVTSTGATTKNIACSGNVTAAPLITTSVSTLSGFTYMYTAGPSAQQSFTVSGSNLLGNVIVTPPADYELSTTSGSGFAASAITLTQTGGVLSATTLYIRLKLGLGVGSHNQNITASSSNAITQNIACAGTVTVAPTITTSTSSLAGFIYTLGAGPSNQQSFTVVGTNLSANVIVTPPTNYEISTTSGSGFQTTALTLTQSGGNVNTTIYARLVAGLGVGTYGPANVSLTSTGAVVKSISFSGSVVNTATILSSKSTLTGFGYLFSAGGPSSEQLFSVSGASLTANVVVTPPANYEISTTSGTGFQSTPITLTRTGGIVGPSTIYVRLKSGLAAGNYSGVNITLSSTGVTTKNVACVGIVFISPLITAGGGGSYCEGSTVNLTSVGADILNRYWQGPNGFYSNLQNPTITNATSAMSGTYSVTGNVTVGGNLITNGDFEAGNTSFGSSYAVSNGAVDGLWPESVYAVIANPQSQHSNFSACGDHTSGTGKQMVINGSPTAGSVIWTQSVPVIPGAYYEYTYWVQTVVATSPSQLQLYANGIAVGPVYTADASTCTWKQFSYNTNAGSNSTLNLELINQNIVANGNDFALDDIVFQQILPATSSVNVTVSPIFPVSVSVTASANPVFTNTPVTFTATPTNGGFTPAYQWKVNGVAVSGATNSTYIYTPLDGDIVLCELTSSLTCVTNNPANANVVMDVIPRVNYWYGYIDTNWGNPSNWTANYVPLTGDDVEYATVANFGSTAINDLQLDIDRTIGSLINATTKRLLIPAAKGLLVNNTITTDNNPDRIYIYSSTTLANGSLAFHNTVNAPVYASVEMYSKASWDLSQIQGSRYQWQYFGIPLRSVVAYPQFADAYIRKWYETGTTISNHWIMLKNDSIVRPFYGYEICQQNPKTYLFKGALENGNFASGQLAITSNALFPGQHIFSNPYTAAIDIRQLTFGAQTESSVYLYHTGTYNAWTTGGETSPGTLPGYYISIPINQAGNFGIPRQVPSMQAMLVKAMSVSSLATFGINYNSVVMNNTDAQRAPKMENAAASGKVSTMIELKGDKSEDKLWLMSNESCTRNFDNGWDGFKIIGSALSPQLFAMEKDGNYQVNAVNDINDTELGFQAGTDTEYALMFSHENLQRQYAGIYLVDLVENKTIDVSENGTHYTFMAESTPSPIKRFKIVTRPYEKDAADKDSQLKVFSAKGSVFVQNLSSADGEFLLYNMAGRMIKSVAFYGNGISNITSNLAPGAYIVKAHTNNEEVSKRIIVQ